MSRWFMAFLFAEMLLGKVVLAGELGVWAIGEGVRINPLTGKAFEENAAMLPGGISGDYRAKNWVWDGAMQTVTLKGAANEVVSFQLIIEGSGAKGINVTAADLSGADRVIPARQYGFFRAFYIKVKQAVDGKRAPYPLEEGWYPDPLVPFETPCQHDNISRVIACRSARLSTARDLQDDTCFCAGLLSFPDSGGRGARNRNGH
jgi:hypothetical protein